jgi:hypothetical protein
MFLCVSTKKADEPQYLAKIAVFELGFFGDFQFKNLKKS